ncbi:terminase small subunit, partial [Vibrio phage D479]
MDNLQEMLSGLTNIDELDIPGALEGDHEIAEYEPPKIVPVDSNPSDRKPDLQHDYKTAREMVHFQQEILRLAMLKQFENATQCDLPRQMEVLATLSTQITNSTKQLLDIQKQMKDVTQEQVTTGQGNNAGTQIQADQVFVGNPNDFLSEVGSRQEHLREKGKII